LLASHSMMAARSYVMPLGPWAGSAITASVMGHLPGAQGVCVGVRAAEGGWLDTALVAGPPRAAARCLGEQLQRSVLGAGAGCAGLAAGPAGLGGSWPGLVRRQRRRQRTHLKASGTPEGSSSTAGGSCSGGGQCGSLSRLLRSRLPLMDLATAIISASVAAWGGKLRQAAVRRRRGRSWPAAIRLAHASSTRPGAGRRPAGGQSSQPGCSGGGQVQGRPQPRKAGSRQPGTRSRAPHRLHLRYPLRALRLPRAGLLPLAILARRPPWPLHLLAAKVLQKGC
jgi:hypothetical protein